MPSQNFCTLFTSATMRQSWRWFASAPVRHSDETSDGVSPLPDLLLVERAELAERAAAAHEREQEVNDEPDDAEPAASEREPAGPHPATAGVGDLAGVESRSGAEPHRRCVPRPPPSKRAPRD